MKNLKTFEQFINENSSKEEELANLIFDESNEDYYDTYQKIDGFFSDMSEKEMEKFCDDVKMPRKIQVGDLCDFHIEEWPDFAQNKAIEYLLKNKKIDSKGKWIEE